MQKNHNIVEVDGFICAETDKAIKFCSFTTSKRSWLPRSVVEIEMTGKMGQCTIQLPEDIATDKELL